MIEDAVKKDSYTLIMKRLANDFEIFIGTKAAIHRSIVFRIISMGITLKKRIEQHRVCSGGGNVIHPVQQAKNPVRQHSVILLWCAAKSQWIDLIDGCMMIPHSELLSLVKEVTGH